MNAPESTQYKPLYFNTIVKPVYIAHPRYREKYAM